MLETQDSMRDAKDTSQTQLVDGLGQLFDSGDYSDFTIQCAEHEWKLHCAVLCPRSTYFTNACKQVFQEGISHVIKLKGDDPVVLQEVLKACYTCSYNNSVGSDDKLDFNARVYAMADKYGIPFLKDLSKAMFQVQLDEPMDTPCFLKAVRTAYTTTLRSDRGLRDLLLPVLKKHRNTLQKDDQFLDLIKSGLADGDFAADVIATLSQLLDPKPELQ